MTKEARIYDREKMVSSIQSFRLKDILESYLWPRYGSRPLSGKQLRADAFTKAGLWISWSWSLAKRDLLSSLVLVFPCCCRSVTKFFQLFVTPWTAARQALVLHYLPEFAEIHVHWVGDVIQPSHPLSPTSPPSWIDILVNSSFFRSCFNKYMG